MRVLLISANTETINMVPLPLGLNCVAVAARNAGHHVQMVDLMGSAGNAAILREAMERFRPEIIGISVRNVDNQQMSEVRFLLEPVREIVVLCRSLSRAPIVVGGAGFSIFPEAVLAYLGADMGICGEGEVAFNALLAAMEGEGYLKAIQGLCLPGEPAGMGTAERGSLEALPLPDPSLWSIPPDAGGEIWVPIQTRRGCPMKCSYCSTPALEGTRVRMHSVAAVIEGLARHVAAGFDHFYFVDNTFNFPPEYATDLCAAIRSAGLKIQWRCILYPAFLNREMVGKMAEAGCVEVSLGFESGSLEMLRSLNKKYDTEQVRAASELLKEQGIRRIGFLLLGGPGETRESVLESLAFADSLKLDMLKVSVGIRIYPNTPLARTAVERGVISQDDDLLLPRFYLEQGLEDWLGPMIREWVASRPYCFM